MSNRRILSLILVFTAYCAASGCRAHPGSLAIMIVGDVISDIDVKQRWSKLQGQPPSKADEMFGERIETLVGVGGDPREMVVYPVSGDLLGSSRYVVEVSEAKIAALTKTTQNIDGVEDLIKAAGLRKKLEGKSPAECVEEGDLEPPVLVLRNRADGNLVRVYDVRNATNLRGARFCILRFDGRDRCAEVNLVGVGATTNKEPKDG
jgi:hypothetical protein